MTYTYTILGITCGGCKASIEKALIQLPQVTNVLVDVARFEATIDMSEHVTIENLQRVLPKKYQITVKNTFENSNSIASQKSDLKQLFPLFLILGYISFSSILINYKSWDITSFMLDFMGLFYIVFSFFKLLDLKGFPEGFKMYDPLAKKIPLYGWVYPFIEVALGLMFLIRFQIPIALVVTLIILGITTIGVTKILLDKKSIACACLGTVLKLPMTKATFIENSIMIAMAIIMLFK